MGCFKKFSSLKERASYQVAINLCQDSDFKEVALCLEKPTYGAIINIFSKDYFTSDPELLSAYDIESDWRNTQKKKNFTELFDVFIDKRVGEWYEAIDEQCERLTEEVPLFLKRGVHDWMNRIALEYLSYSRWQETLFGIPCYILMDTLKQEDWMEAGQLDQMKLAKRLLGNEQFTLLQRYRIACVHWLPENIIELWNRLTQEEKLFVTGMSQLNLFQEKNSLVLYWSYYMNSHEDYKDIRTVEFGEFIHKAVHYGNRAGVKQAWKELNADTRQHEIIQMALVLLKSWNGIRNDDLRRKLVWHELPCPYLKCNSVNFNLHYHYSDLLQFFLVEMHEEQQLMFFQEAFQIESVNSILECFLDWPFRENFLSIMNRLWGIIPMPRYRHCLLTIAYKYCFISHYKKVNNFYDYGSLFFELWEETPENYKQYIFTTRYHDWDCITQKRKGQSDVDYLKTVLEIFMLQLIKLSPFKEKDEALFKQVLYILPKKTRKEMIYSNTGEEICSTFIQEEKLPFVNWMLEECLPRAEISLFKKHFIQSDWSRELCLRKFLENERYLADLIDWAFESDAEKMQFKSELIYVNINLSDDEEIHIC